MGARQHGLIGVPGKNMCSAELKAVSQGIFHSRVSLSGSLVRQHSCSSSSAPNGCSWLAWGQADAVGVSVKLVWTHLNGVL